MDKVQSAEAAFTKAGEGLKVCQDAVTAIETDRAKAQAELDAIEALDQVSPDQHVTESNLKRRIRKLGEQLEVAQAAVMEAEKVRDAAAAGVTEAKWDRAAAEAQALDRAFIEDAKESAIRLEAKREAYHEKKQELIALGYELNPAPGAPRRHVPNLFTSMAPWNENVFLGAQKVLAAVAAHENPYVRKDPMEAARNRPVVVYMPPWDEHGRWVGPGPDPGHGPSGP